MSSGITDDDEIIEQLLDSLEAQYEPSKRGPSKRGNKHDPSNASSSEMKTLAEEAHELLGLLGPETNQDNCADSEAFSTLLKEFCVEGDERVVDELLDNFLGPDCDVGKLIESLSKGIPSAAGDFQPAPAVKSDQNKKKMVLDLEGVRGLNSLDTLLGSARGVLQSARQASKERPKRRPHSAHPRAAEKKKKPRPKSAHPTVGMLKSPRKSTSPRKVTDSPRKVISPRKAKPASEEAERSSSKVTQDVVVNIVPPGATAERSSNEAAALSANIGDSNQPEALDHTPTSCENDIRPGVKLLARIAEMEDTEAMRGFVKRFLIGVRRRVMTGTGTGTQAGVDALAEAQTADGCTGYESSGSGSWESYDDDRAVEYVGESSESERDVRNSLDGNSEYSDYD